MTSTLLPEGNAPVSSGAVAAGTASAGTPTRGDARSLGLAGVEAELCDALDRALDIEEYLAARDGGASHAEVLEVAGLSTLRICLRDYGELRRRLTHAQAMAVVDAGFWLDAYLSFEAAGIPYAEALEGWATGSSHRYLRLRGEGRSHRYALRHAATFRRRAERAEYRKRVRAGGVKRGRRRTGGRASGRR